MFNKLFIFASGWFVAGLYLDGWAHTHLDSSLETFFTPWHGVFYSGFVVIVLLLLWQAWRRSLSHEYKISLWGVLLFLASGVGDFLWHELFGIESGLDALLSPTHLLLAISLAVIVSAPLHTVWSRTIEHRASPWTAMISATFVFSTIMFMLQFLNPFNFPWLASSFNAQFPLEINYAGGLGIANSIIYTLILMGMLISLLRFIKIPFGGFTLILSISTLAMTLMHGQYYIFIITALASGIIIDFLYRLFYSKHSGRHALRTFGFLTPVIIFTAYVLTIIITDKIWWSLHLTSGMILIVGIMGYLITFVNWSPVHNQNQ